ncbi:MAG: DUF4126 domain-containing protein [Acidobacteriota bacterium]
MEMVLSVLLGIGLAAACGFRVFVPPLVMSIAALSGHLTLAPGFDWIGTWPALLAFATATVLEIAAYYVPWLDNLLDALASPAAVVAGIVVTASVVEGTSPLLRWTLAVVAGGGAAALVQAVTVKVRALSSLFTFGLGNPAVSTAEAAGAAAVSTASVVFPLLGALTVFAILAAALLLLARRGRGASNRPAGRR